MSNILKKPLRGIIPPMVTPLKDQSTLDVAGLERLIEHMISGGVHGVFILGTTGEAPSLTPELRYELTERVCTQVARRVPVLVGITDTSPIGALRMAEKAAACGADAVVSAPPYYYALNQQELRDYFTSMADEMPLPLFLYNIPSHTGVHFEADTVCAIAEHENVTGLKDSSADMMYFQTLTHLTRENPEFTLLAGREELLMQTVLQGGHGGVSGGANMFPHLYVEMYEAAADRDFNRMPGLQERIIQISSTIYTLGQSNNRYLQGVKCTLSLMGICDGFIARPLYAFERSERQIIQRRLKSLNIKLKL